MKAPEKALVTVDIIVINYNLNVLLIQRGHEPGKGLWALPGGHIDLKEDPLDAAHRELKEETGIDGVNLHLFDVRKPSALSGELWKIKTIYYCVIPSNYAGIKAGDDAVAFKWQPIVQLVHDDKLFADHNQIIHDYFYLHMLR